jgi:hypothetical protein
MGSHGAWGMGHGVVTAGPVAGGGRMSNNGAWACGMGMGHGHGHGATMGPHRADHPRPLIR